MRGMDFDTILSLLAALADQPLLLVLAIVASTLASEDAATIAVGVLASQALLSIETALVALLIGTIAGDIGLHLIGRQAMHIRWCARFAQRPAAIRAVDALRANAVAAMTLARFVPGSRLPVYVGSGLAGVPLWQASLIIAGASLVWTPALFGISMVAGTMVSHSLGWVALPGLVLFGLLAVRLRRSYEQASSHIPPHQQFGFR